MKNIHPNQHPAKSPDDLIEALNNMRDAWTRASLELRDIQFDLDELQRHQVAERVLDLVNKVKPR